MAVKPRIFVGSSVEGLHVAEHIQLGLDYHAECTVWSQGVFGLSEGTLESLFKAVTRFDFAVLVLTPDDLVHKRAAAKNSPRDNVLFELGLFMGALGRDHTFIVYCRDIPIDLPTDLAGVTAATFAKRSDGNLQAALGTVCTQIKLAIKEAHKPGSAAPGTSDSAAMGKLQDELASMRADLAAQTESVRRMMEAITSDTARERRLSRETADSALDELRTLEGIWKGAGGSTACAKMYKGELRWPYCYLGNESLTGEYHNFKLIHGALFGRFRWLGTNDVRGYCYYRIVSPTQLSGGWWYGHDVPEHLIAALPSVPGMRAQIWTKQGGIDQFPDWAIQYYEALAKANPER